MKVKATDLLKCTSVERKMVRDAVLAGYRKLFSVKPLIGKMFVACQKEFSENRKYADGNTMVAHVTMDKLSRCPKLVLSYPTLIDFSRKLKHEQFMLLVQQIIEHEMLHLVLCHLKRSDGIHDTKFSRLLNIAEDAIINSSRFVDMAHFEPVWSTTTYLSNDPKAEALSAIGCFVGLKGELDNLLEKPFAMYNGYELALYYQKMKPLQDQPKNPDSGKGQKSDQEEETESTSSASDEDENQNDSSKSDPSASTKGKDGETETAPAEGAKDGGDETTEDVPEAVSANDPDFKNWSQKVTAGSSGELSEFEVKFNLRRKPDFASVFRHKVNTFVRSPEHATRQTVNDRTRLSRRFPQFLTVPGHKRVYVNPKNLYVWVDISGSMDLEFIKVFLVNLDKVIVGEMRVTVIAYNHDYSQHFLHRRGKFPTMYNGGGTCFLQAYRTVTEKGLLSHQSDCVHLVYSDCDDSSLSEETVSLLGNNCMLVYPETSHVPQIQLFRDRMALSESAKTRNGGSI